MSEHISAVRYRISVEGADESISEFQTIMGEVQRGISIFSQLDYLALSFQRTMEHADLRSFLSLALSTISVMTTIINMVKSAEAAQLAYNAALVMTRLLEGPTGWAILGVAGFTAGAVTHALTTPGAAQPAEMSEAEKRRREAYRAIVP